MIRPVLFGLLQKGVEFIYLEKDGHSASEIRNVLIRQRIPIKTWGWHREVIEAEGMAPVGPSAEETAANETQASRDIKANYEQPDLDTGVEGADYDRQPMAPQRQGFLGWSFYCKRTQAFYAHQILIELDVHFVKVPRSAQKPRSAMDLSFSAPQRRRKKRKRHKWRY